MSAFLAGRTILIVEDEFMIATDLADLLTSEGATAIVASTMSDAMQKADDPGIRVAIVDHKLGRETTGAVCARLKARNVPFILYTGYGETVADGAGAVLQKPAMRSELLSALQALLGDST
jgi:DNA-binding response OmpR family regulator